MGAAALVASLVVGAPPASAVQPPPVREATSCADCAASPTATGDWACVDDTLTTYTETGQVASVTRLRPAQKAGAAGGGVSTLAVVDASRSNVTEPIYATLGGQAYGVSVTVRATLYNHSAALSMRYSSASPVSLTWNVRVRRDDNLAADDTIDTEPDLYGSSLFHTPYTTSEDQYGTGYNALPYDGKRYFVDLYNLFIKSPDGHAVNIAGSVQSDRMTCCARAPYGSHRRHPAHRAARRELGDIRDHLRRRVCGRERKLYVPRPDLVDRHNRRRAAPGLHPGGQPGHPWGYVPPGAADPPDPPAVVEPGRAPARPGVWASRGRLVDPVREHDSAVRSPGRSSLQRTVRQ